MPVARQALEMLVRRLALHGSLAPAERALVLALPHTLRTMEASSYLMREGDVPRACPVLVSGLAFRQKLTGQGARQILGLAIPGDAVDLQHLFLDQADHNIQMLTRGDVALVSRVALQDLFRTSPPLSRAIMAEALVCASVSREWIVNIGRRDARTRLAHFLCEFATRLESVGLGEEYGFDLPMTQEQLADVCGLTPVHVNRTIRRMESEGLITRDRRALRFPDWERMRDVGDFNARYLHLGHETGMDGEDPAPSQPKLHTG